ncbi:MAG: hypothetical protein ACYC6N_23440 [Pirellulaceae bacterium]
MIKGRFGFVIVALLLASWTSPALTRAHDDCWFGSRLGPTAFGVSGSLYGLGYLPVPPYFALHPPVYYGERYYRTYGESPFPRVDYSSRPHRIQADVIVNPFVTTAAVTPVPTEPTPVDGAENKDQVTDSPLMIINPFYQSEATVAHRD